MLVGQVNSPARCDSTSTPSNLANVAKTQGRKPLKQWQLEDAARLKALFATRAKMSQEKFGEAFEIGTQGAVWQYLHGRVPLNLDAALKFAKGLKCTLADISPILDKQIQRPGVAQPSGQYTIEAAGLLEDFNALPEWLKEHIARKTAELRRYADSLPEIMKEGMKAPPKDPESYRTWERNIEAEMARRGGKAVKEKK